MSKRKRGTPQLREAVLIPKRNQRELDQAFADFEEKMEENFPGMARSDSVAKARSARADSVAKARRVAAAADTTKRKPRGGA